jgi:hypothetical protein
MRITDPTQFMALGGRIRYLVGIREGQRIGGSAMILENLETLRASLVDLGFSVSKNLFDQTLDTYVKSFALRVAADNDARISKSDVKRLKRSMADFERTVQAEARTKMIALPTQRRIPLESLLRAPQKVLGKSVFAGLSPLAQEDLRQACRCIAFDCPTAAAFHILRCVEDCVRRLYSSYFRRRKIGKQTWGQLVTALRQKKHRPKPDATLLEHLDHLRTHFRNPTDQPDKCYEIEEAEDLIHISG